MAMSRCLIVLCSLVRTRRAVLSVFMIVIGVSAMRSVALFPLSLTECFVSGLAKRCHLSVTSSFSLKEFRFYFPLSKEDMLIPRS